MKSIKELYKPKSADEKRFVDKHIVKKTEDANGNKDEVFNATTVKSVRDDSKEKLHGHAPGKDEEVYEGNEKNLAVIKSASEKSKLNHLLKTRKDSKAHAAIKYGKLAKEYERKDKDDDAVEESKLSDACWKGYKAVGHKMKEGKKVPNCVPESVVTEGKSIKSMSDAELKQKHDSIGKKIADMGGVSANHRLAQQRRLIRVVLAIRKAGGFPMSKNVNESFSKMLDRAEAAHKAGDMGAVKQHLKDIKRYGMTAKVKEMGNPELSARYKKLKSAVSEELQIDEVLKPSMGVKAYIDDFVKSDDPKFKGISKKERIKRALAAYYSARGMKKEDVSVDDLDQINELDVETLERYKRKAGKDIRKRIANFQTPEKSPKLQKRIQGYRTAWAKIEDGVMKKEDIEMEDEYIAEAKESREAMARYNHYHGQVKDSLKNLSAALDSHRRNAKENNIHWGHVGDIKNIHRMLQDMHDQITQTNDYFPR